MLGDIVIAAKHRGHHRTSLPERLLHRSRRAHGSWHDLRSDPGLVLAPELTEKLVQITDYPRERCRADTLLIGVKPADESDFSANTDAAALTSQLDILQAGGGMAIRLGVTRVGRRCQKKGSKSHAC